MKNQLQKQLATLLIPFAVVTGAKAQSITPAIQGDVKVHVDITGGTFSGSAVPIVPDVAQLQPSGLNLYTGQSYLEINNQINYAPDQIAANGNALAGSVDPDIARGFAYTQTIGNPALFSGNHVAFDVLTRSVSAAPGVAAYGGIYTSSGYGLFSDDFILTPLQLSVDPGQTVTFRVSGLANNKTNCFDALVQNGDCAIGTFVDMSLGSKFNAASMAFTDIGDKNFSLILSYTNTELSTKIIPIELRVSTEGGLNFNAEGDPTIGDIANWAVPTLTVPEPGTGWMIVAGLAAGGAMVAKRRRYASPEQGR